MVEDTEAGRFRALLVSLEQSVIGLYTHLDMLKEVLPTLSGGVRDEIILGIHETERDIRRRHQRRFQVAALMLEAEEAERGLQEGGF